MNIITPINPMLTDEHVLAVDPKPLPDGVETLRKRINAFEGRSLSADALTDLQYARVAHQSMLGRAVSSGVVRGLEVDWLKTPDSFVIRPGMGLTATGEDIFLGGSEQFKLANLPVLIPQPTDKPPRILGFSELKSNTDAVSSRAAILLAVPIIFTDNSVPPSPPNKFVPRDPVDDPFAGLQDSDGCMFALYPLPSSTPLDPAKPSFRNDLAQAIFAEERAFGNGECHRWEEHGLALALIGFDADFNIQFVDRASVVRRGGQSTPRTSVVKNTGNRSLWHAQLEQFGEQLGSLAALPDNVADLQKKFPKLPPIGFLPTRLAGFESSDSIFPSTFSLSAVPVPEDQLEIIIRENISLDAVDLSKGEKIELAFPVPAKDYEPRLMWQDNIAPDFDNAINDFLKQRNDQLARREIVHIAHEKLSLARTGDFDFQSGGDALAPDELDARFAGRRLTKLDSNNSLAFKAYQNKAVLGLGDSLYIRAWLGSDVTKFVLNASGFANFDLNRAKPTKASLYKFVWGNSDRVEGGVFDKGHELPKAENWVSISVSCLDCLQSKLINPASSKLSSGSNMEFGAFGFEVEGGKILIAEMGILDAAGNEKAFLSDSLPEAEPQKDIPSNFETWPWTNPTQLIDEDGYGTALQQNLRDIPQFSKFIEKISKLDFLGVEASRLSELPLANIVDTLTAQIKATTDAVDLGFLMARANTFRVREFMLGSDAASRLATSPALADVVKQDTSARVTGEQLQTFLEKNKFNFTRGVQ